MWEGVAQSYRPRDISVAIAAWWGVGVVVPRPLACSISVQVKALQR
jgi:hypothetical protein